MWTAPPDPGIVPMELVIIGAPTSGSSGARAVPVAIGDSGGPRDHVAGSAVVGGVWVLQGSRWQEFSDEALFLEGSTFGGATVACTTGPAISGPWHGAVWLSTGGLTTLAAGFIELASALFGGLDEGVDGGRVVALAFAGALPVAEETAGITQPQFTMFDFLIRSQATLTPPPPVFPPDGTLIELFVVPFAGAMVETSFESTGSGPLPLASLETRPRLPIERIAGEIVFGPLLTPSPGATVQGPGGTISQARLYWRDVCPLSASTVADAIDEFENLGNPFGP